MLWMYATAWRSATCFLRLVVQTHLSHCLLLLAHYLVAFCPTYPMFFLYSVDCLYTELLPFPLENHIFLQKPVSYQSIIGYRHHFSLVVWHMVNLLPKLRSIEPYSLSTSKNCLTISLSSFMLYQADMWWIPWSCLCLMAAMLFIGLCSNPSSNNTASPSTLTSLGIPTSSIQLSRPRRFMAIDEV